MINPFIFALLSMLVSGICVFLMYNQTLILLPRYYFFIGLFSIIIYIFVKYSTTINRRADKIFGLSMSVFLTNILSSMVYFNWKLSNLISNEVITKITVVSLTILAVHLNLFYIRAESSYKRKRGNQRIREEPNSMFFKKIAKSNNTQEDDLVLVLGRSAENEESH